MKKSDHTELATDWPSSEKATDQTSRGTSNDHSVFYPLSDAAASYGLSLGSPPKPHAIIGRVFTEMAESRVRDARRRVCDY